jgi:signal transduction histidine kinase
MPDHTERKPTQKALGNLSGRLLKAQEEERRRIGRELHDDIGQRLGWLVLELEQTKTLGYPNVRIQNRLNRVRHEAAEILNAVQSLSHELHSPKLEYLGLAAAARSLCREFGEQHKIPVEFAEIDLPSAIPQEISICLFRVLQEALHNIAKHSRARFADVKLQASRNEIRLSIRDSGVGFDSEAPIHGEGLGLISMRERVHLVKGNILIRSKHDFGTEISVRVPLQLEGSELCRRQDNVRRIRIVHSGPGDTRDLQ